MGRAVSPALPGKHKLDGSSLGVSNDERFRVRSAQRIGGTMLYQKPSELVSNGVIVRRLLNVGETALYLGVKVDTVYKWSRMGVLSKVKLGGALRFDVNVLDRFIEQHSTKTIDY
jgi:excisionase family DNA binding protein